MSGPCAFAAARAIAGDLPPARRLARRRLTDPETHAPIDDALVAAFAAPQSFTGEDVVEFHLHGGLVATRRLLQALAALDGLEPAPPGAFSRRAFLNSRLDLAQAEAIADLIDAETEAQARQALHQLDGALGRRVAAWGDRLLSLRAALEARLDFADEGDVAGAEPAAEGIERLRDEVATVLGDARGERLRAGLRVALVGRPNAGKSSLLNALAQREVAIVTPVPGTTRDVLEVALELDGWPLTLIDMAGLRHTDDAIEAEGVRRAEGAAASADLRLFLIDGALWPDPAASPPLTPTPEDLLVLSKADLAPELSARWHGSALVPVSTRSAGGLDAVLDALRAVAATGLGGADAALWTRERHRHALAAAAVGLDRAVHTADPVLQAEELRRAQQHLGTLTGGNGVEALLDRLFATFCIGK